MKKYLMMSIIILGVVGVFIFGNNPKMTSEYKNSVNEMQKLSRQEKQGCVVLSYHQVKTGNVLYETFGYQPKNNEHQLYNVYLKDFKAQMDDLAKNQVNVLSLDEMYNRMQTNTLPDKCAVITFDDIDQSVYTNAYPVLKAHNFPFTVFPIMGKLGKEYDYGTYASLEQIKTMKDSGLATVGLHTYDMHKQDKTGKPIFLDDTNLAAFKQDTQKSIRAYEHDFKQEPEFFAYPYGFGTPKTDAVLQAAGLKANLTLRRGIVNKETKPFYIPRVIVTKINFPIFIEWFTN